MRSWPFAPPRRGQTPAIPARLEWLREQAFAHRGLHGGPVAENSRSAFQAAAAQGYGIECDVRLSRDGFAIVFHDASLGRLTGVDVPTSRLTAAELAELTLAGGADRIESLADILRGLAGAAPLLIELKTDGDSHVAARLSLSVRHALEGYRGDAAVMSFDPAVGRWFAAHAPRIVRGLVIGQGEGGGVRANMRRLLSLRSAKPHFLACDVRSLPSAIARRARRRGLPVLAWTVRTREEHALARACADEVIFEFV